MRAFLALSAVAFVAGCAAPGDTQVATADCKVAPITTASVAGRKSSRPLSSIEQRDAEFQLASTDYRFRKLQENGIANNNVEEALRDCNRK